jgi:alpha-galactosidase
MRRIERRVMLCGYAFLTASLPDGGVALAQTISMTASPATPELHGPFLYAARPGTPFLFTVPATGQATLSFSATGLPVGLTIASGTGTISGTTPAAGSYPVVVTAMNGSGSATATYTITASSTYALTPPMGWNSYDSYGSSVTESEFLAAATALKSQLQPYGWSTAVIDYLWFDPEDNIDSNGRWQPSPSKWPSSSGGQGFKMVADQVHAMGLLFGIHIMRGIPRKAFAANTPIANSTYKAMDAGNSGDTCPWDSHNYGVLGSTAAGQAWYDSIFAQYASWGLDFVKVDDMISGTNYHQTEVDAIRAAIDKSGRSIVLSLSPGPMQTANVADLEANANLWRTVNDFWDTNGLSNLTDVFNAAGSWQTQTTLTQGHWPDCDMLPLGYIGPRAPVGGSSRTNSMSALSHADQVSVMSLWGIMPSPLIFGGNPTKLTSDSWTTALLANPELLAVNQDASGTHAKRISSSGNTQVWSRDLTADRKAVALFNLGTTTATVSATFSQLGLTGTPAVRDVWQRMDVTGMTSGLSASIPAGSAVMYVLSSPGSAGAGGTGGSMDSAGSGAAGGSTGVGGTAGVGSGGAGAPGGSGGMGATVGSGGASNTAGNTGSGGVKGTGGVIGSGGASGSSGASSFGGSAGSGASKADSTSSAGCACALAVERTPQTAPWLMAATIVLLLSRRRPRERPRSAPPKEPPFPVGDASVPVAAWDGREE